MFENDRVLEPGILLCYVYTTYVCLFFQYKEPLGCILFGDIHATLAIKYLLNNELTTIACAKLGCGIAETIVLNRRLKVLARETMCFSQRLVTVSVWPSDTIGDDAWSLTAWNAPVPTEFSKRRILKRQCGLVGLTEKF